MIEKKTVIDQIEVTRTGAIQIRFGKLLVEDGQEISCQWHRTIIEPGVDADAQLATVDEHLQQMGCSVMERDRVAQLKSIVGLVHTPEVVAEFRAKRTSEVTGAASPGAPNSRSGGLDRP